MLNSNSIKENMTELIDFQKGNVVGLHIDGKITEEEFEKIASFCEDKLKEFKNIRLYAELESYGGMAPSAVLKDVKFGIKHWNQIEKEALVTDQKWMQKITEAADTLFPNIEVKAFPVEEKKWAKKWISE